jgi:hypothetical protein
MDPQPPGSPPPGEPPAQPPEGGSTPPAWVPPAPVANTPTTAAARPGAVTAAAVVLIVCGVLVGLLGLLFVLGGSLIGSMGDAPELQEQLGGVPAAFGGFIATIGLIVVVYGIAQIVTGIYVFPGKSWARIAGLILAVLGGLLALLGMFPSDQGVNAGGILVSLVILAAYAFTAWALATNGRWFGGALDPR